MYRKGKLPPNKRSNTSFRNSNNEERTILLSVDDVEMANEWCSECDNLCSDHLCTELSQVIAAPSTFFQKESLPNSHGFKEGHMLECIDPENQNLICVVSVKKVQGSRLLLHFDSYREEYDFWENAGSPNLFPTGWCQQNDQILTPPKGYSSASFSWTEYLKLIDSTAAPESNFIKQDIVESIPNWTIGMKLEAEDKYDRDIISVATVANIMSSGDEDRVLLEFDGWDHHWDYWTRTDGPYAHPVGWCQRTHRELYPPQGYHPDEFSWPNYLQSTSSTKVPDSGFNHLCSMKSKFEPGMQLEAVDLANPWVVRPARVVEVDERQIKLNYEGWPEKFDQSFDDTDPRLYPWGYCHETQHILMPDFNTLQKLQKYDKEPNSHSCPVPGCLGIGHIIGGAKYPSHSLESDCPYSVDNLENGTQEIPNRLEEDGKNTKRKTRKRKLNK